MDLSHAREGGSLRRIPHQDGLDEVTDSYPARKRRNGLRVRALRVGGSGWKVYPKPNHL